MKTLTTKLFVSAGAINCVSEYDMFLSNNQNIEIVSLNVLGKGVLLLTYYE